MSYWENYSGLQAAIAGHSIRSDLAAVIPDFISLFEAHANRVLRVTKMETYSTGTPDTAGEILLPTDFLEAKRVQAAGSPPLSHVSRTWAASQFPTGDGSTPRYYTLQGLTMTVWPAGTGEIQLDYYEKIPALSDDNTTNWLLRDHPDAYLQGAMVELLMHVKNLQEAEVRAQRRNVILSEIRALDGVQRPMTIRLRGATP